MKAAGLRPFLKTQESFLANLFKKLVSNKRIEKSRKRTDNRTSSTKDVFNYLLNWDEETKFTRSSDFYKLHGFTNIAFTSENSRVVNQFLLVELTKTNEK